MALRGLDMPGLPSQPRRAGPRGSGSRPGRARSRQTRSHSRSWPRSRSSSSARCVRRSFARSTSTGLASGTAARTPRLRPRFVEGRRDVRAGRGQLVAGVLEFHEGVGDLLALAFNPCGQLTSGLWIPADFSQAAWKPVGSVIDRDRCCQLSAGGLKAADSPCNTRHPGSRSVPASRGPGQKESGERTAGFGGR